MTHTDRSTAVLSRPSSILAPEPGTTAELVFADADTGFSGRIAASWHTDRSDDPGWVADVVGSLRPGERAVCAFSFEDDQPAVAHHLTELRPIPGGIAGLRDQLAVAAAASPTEPRTHRVSEHPSAQDYAAAVTDALDRIDGGTLAKVVLGRGLEVACDPSVPAAEMLYRLAGGVDGTPAGRYLYAVPVTPDELLLGASPELLVRRRGNRVDAMPLAGSLPRSVATSRAAATEHLLSSGKDLAEHAHVVQDLVQRLSEVCHDVRAEAPEVIGTDSMWHLGTRISATPAPRSLTDPAASALALARLVHPTPAVGGVPLTAALATVVELEAAPRGWFAGAVGWVDADGDGEFALTLRSGLLAGPRLRLWAGAGIVAGSDVATEVRETAAKLTTMTRAVGL